MKKTIRLALCLLAVLLLLSGCKIEKVEDVVSETTSSISASETQNDSTTESTNADVSQNAQATTAKQDAETEKNKAPVPTAPKPQDGDAQTIDKSSVKSCYLSVECKTILNNKNNFNKDKLSILPADGIIFSKRKVTFNEGETVFDILNREMRKNRVHMEFTPTPIYNSNYIEGIGNIYEFDCGELSGWMYSVNGVFPNYGVSRYKLSDGDNVEFKYTCDLGRDLGHEWDGVYDDK